MRTKAGTHFAQAARAFRAAALISAVLATFTVAAAESPTPSKEPSMPHKAYVYTELQISVPFENLPWARINSAIKAQPGFIDKTWLSGAGNQSAGGFYTFDSIENAQKFVTGYFPAEARSFGVAQTTRVFDAAATQAASRAMNSVHYDGKLDVKPGAFVYTEVQLQALPFAQAAPWRELNPVLKQQPGLLSKTWLSGLHTGTPGGLYAFDTLEHAQAFAVEYFPTEAKKLNAAFYTRVFDARGTEAASIEMHSPYYR
ncbi:MAG: YdhR family protein [Pseudomonadota bacterium]